MFDEATDNKARAERLKSAWEDVAKGKALPNTADKDGFVKDKVKETIKDLNHKAQTWENLVSLVEKACAAAGEDQ